jgi:hypothetical protein
MYQQQQQGHSNQVDYSYYAQAEMLRARLMASPNREDGGSANNSGSMSAISPQTSMSPRSPSMTPRLDPKVEALLRELNYHEDESITGLFIEGRISWEALKTFTKADLAELGLPFGPRTAIYNLLQRPSPQVSQETTPVPPAKAAQQQMRARIGYDDLTFMCKLGTGAFGDVWKGKLRGTTTVAIKTLKANGDYQNFRVEAQIMAYASIAPHTH